MSNFSPKAAKIRGRPSFVGKLSKTAPRLTSLASYFEMLASGKRGVPQVTPRADFNLFHHYAVVRRFCKLYSAQMGTFFKHYTASVPFVLEEDCRLGAAIYEYAREKYAITQLPLNFLDIGAADGTLSRTLAQIADGRIHALCTSATKANQLEFNRLSKKFNLPQKKRATFFLGPYIDLTPERLFHDKKLNKFISGFDIIYEGLTFQMYSKDRENQIKNLIKLLKDKKNGILILFEKYLQEDVDEYRRRENIKDKYFKSKFFSQENIVEKRSAILDSMEKMQVTEKQLSVAVKKFFKYAVITWNSGNFYTLIASNSYKNLHQLVRLMIRPSVPKRFCFTSLPRVPINFNKRRYTFKRMKP